nr:hypothetical protein [Tanacetum cinerariifolium]
MLQPVIQKHRRDNTGGYLSTDFVVSDSKHATFMLKFDGATTMRKAAVNVTGFVRNVGRITYQKSGSRTLEFYLANQRLWGGLGDMIEKKTKHIGMCDVVLTSMFVKNYNNKLYLSSSSSTAIYDDESILSLQELKTQGSVGESSKVAVPVEFSQPKEGTLENVLMWARNQKNDTATFHCKRLKLGVANDTTHVVVVLFDEPATESCLQMRILICVWLVITNLIGTTHVLELKSHTYYEYGMFESFTCWKINPTAIVEEVASSTTVDENTENPSPEFKSLAQTLSDCTPSKGPQERKNKRLEVEESDADDDYGSSKKPSEWNADAGMEKKKYKSGFNYSDGYGSQ